MVSPASVGGDPRRIEGDADDERNYYQGNHAGHMDVEVVSPVESLESSVSWNDHEPTVASSFSSVATIENDIDNGSEIEVKRRAEETCDSTTASIAAIVSKEDNIVVDSEIGNTALEVVSKLNTDRDFLSAAPQPIHNVDGEVPSPHADYRGKSIINHVVKKGDRVRVIKKGEKYGMSGIIARTTKVFVFFEDESTGTRVQIMPKFVELVVEDSTTLSQGRGGVTRQQQQQRPLSEISPPSFDAKRDTPRQAPNEGRQQKQRNTVSPPSQKPTDFPKLSTVLVDKSNRTHGGKVGTVEGHTDCFVQIKFKPGSKKIDRIKPKFLTLVAGDNQSISSSKSSETTSSEITDRNGTPQNDTNSVVERVGYAEEQFEQYRIGKYIVGKLTFIKSSTPVACAFESIWERDTCLPPLEIPLTEQLPSKRCGASGKEYELYYFRIGEDMSGSLLFKKKKNVTAYYVSSEFLQEHEELLADFGVLPAHKVLARRALLFSPAMKIENEYAITRVHATDVTMVDDLGTAGCGFISEQYLEDLLGNKIKAKTALGVQVRIFVPTMGIFKGVLMRKRNMQKSIELNDSLLKVGPSRDPNASDNGWIVVTKSFPSGGNYTFSRVFKIEKHQTHKPLPKSFIREVQKERSFKMSPMYSQVMESLGVSDATIESYRSDYHKHPEKIQHTHLVGMADPTGGLPSNTVFVTGMKGVEMDKLFVTRSPCMERKDGRVLRVVTKKPDSMTSDEWEWLQNLSFGALIFANPKPGDRPLPELIADGDLDGDLYFVCWNKTILTNLNSIPITDDELVAPLDAHTKSKDYDPEWFDKTQRFIAEAPMYHAGIDALVGILHNKWKKIGDINDENAICFARASKYALDLKTHGGLVFLPKHLWDQVPMQLHQYLTADEEDQGLDIHEIV